MDHDPDPDFWEYELDQEHLRQRPVSLRFETKTIWGDLQREFGVNKTGAAIIADICNNPEWGSYSRRKPFYEDNRPRRYRSPLFTHWHMTGQADYLEAAGLIHHAKRRPGGRGWQSAMKATPELLDRFGKATTGHRFTLAKPAELIILRDKDRSLLDYKETRAVGRMRHNVERFNEAISGAGLDPAIAAPLARIFNKTMGRGGRFYSMGASWQNMAKKARREISIGGEPVVELDYKTLHPAILYAQANATMPEDCYAIDGWPRSLVKLAVLILINAKTEPAARRAIAQHDAMADTAQPGSQDAFAKAQQLIDSIKIVHKPIEWAFHTDKGAELMALDASMAEAVMNAMLLQGIVVLPVHDSFLVPASKRDQLEEAMIEAAHKIGLWALQVEAK